MPGLSSVIRDVLQNTYGCAPLEAVREFGLKAMRLPQAARQDFVSMVALELLEERRVACSQGDSLPYDAMAFLRVLGRVTKRIQRATVRLAVERGVYRDVEEQRPAGLSAESRLDFKEAIRGLNSIEMRLLRLRMQGHTLKEIGAKTGLSTTEVHRRVCDIVARLRKLLATDSE